MPYGPTPKESRQRPADEKRRARGTWKPAAGTGWQHGDVPAPPEGLMPDTVEAWGTWMGSWFAAHWAPEDVPGLRVVILLYDQVVRGEYHRAGELRIQMDTYGITPKGHQDRRWKPAEDQPEAPKAKHYGDLRAVEA